MATVYYVGKVQAKPKIMRAAVGSSTVGQTFILTLTTANKTIGYTAVTGDTTTTIAAALLTALGASPDGEWREITGAADPADATAILFTGPADGMPFVFTSTGTGTLTITTPQAATSPHDAAAVGNYSTGALPSAADTLSLRDGAAGPKTGLDALAGIALAAFIRYSTFGHQVGLPLANPAGYVEYRPRYLQLDADVWRIEQTSGDAAALMSLTNVSANLAALTVTGPGGMTSDPPALIVGSLVTASTVAVNGGSIGLALYEGEAITSLASIAARNASVHTGPGCSVGVFEADGSTVLNEGPYSELDVENGATVTVTGSGGCSLAPTAGTIVNSGSLLWQSSGTPKGTTVAVYGGGILDMTGAPAEMPAAMSITLHAGAVVDDSAGRFKTGTAFVTSGCGWQDVTVRTNANRTFTMSFP